MPKKSATATRAKQRAKSLTTRKNAPKKKSAGKSASVSHAKGRIKTAIDTPQHERSKPEAQPEELATVAWHNEQELPPAFAEADQLDDEPIELSKGSEGKALIDSEEADEGEAASEIELELPKELEPKDEKPSSREEDYALIDIIREGNRYQQQQAFKKLLSKYRGQIYNLILKIVHNPNEVEDLVQETFSKTFNSIANFNKEYAFSTWLYRIATNSSIDYLRKRRLKTFSIDNPIKTKDDEYTVEIPDSSDEPEKNVMQSQRDALVREAIEQLPPKYRAVIEMRHLQELSYEEIAEQLKIPLGTVKAHIFRAREMLYKMLRDKLRIY